MKKLTIKFVRCVVLAAICAAVCLTVFWGAGGVAFAATATGDQQWIFAGLRSANQLGAFTAMQRNAAGDLYLLMEQNDGVRVLEFDATGTNVLAQAHLGAAGDIGYGLALDAGGNVYITGSSTTGDITASGNAAFQNATGSGVNGFVARLDAGLNVVFVSYLGGSKISPVAIAANGNAVFVTGVVFGSNLPVTASAVVQTPPSGATENGFVECFSGDGTVLKYATYLGGINGFTAPAAIVTDAAGDAYVGGYTEAAGYPTIDALIAEMIPPVGETTGSGFLSELDAGGDAFVYSTFISGNGVTGMVMGANGTTLYLAGNIAPNGFPVTQWSVPVTNLDTQSLVSMSAAGTGVNWVTAVATGEMSALTVDGGGNVWAVGQMTAPLNAAVTISPIGDAYAVRVNGSGVVDHVVRLGGVAAEQAGNSSVDIYPAGVVTDAAGDVYVAGSLQPATDSSLLGQVFYDLPLLGPAAGGTTTALPNVVRDLVPVSISECNNGSSDCAGSGGYLAEIGVTGGASLVVSTDTLPNLVVRNLGSATATGLTIGVTGYSYTTDCGTSLVMGADCAIALTGAGPGTLTLQSSAMIATETVALAANVNNVAPDALAIRPREVDFGVVSAAGTGATGTFTVTNLTGAAVNFNSALDVLTTRVASPYTIRQSATSCVVVAGTMLTVAANASCTVTLEFMASASVMNDGVVKSEWAIGARDVTLTAYSQAGAIGLSSNELNFGTYYAGGVALPRYLYIENASTTAMSHAVVTLPGNSPFTVSDGCPSTLGPGAVCDLRVNYNSATVPSADSTTLTLDDGLTVLLTGVTEPQPGTVGTGVNPNLNVSPQVVSFAAPVAVTEVSGSAQSVSISNSGVSGFALGLAMTGDFTYTSNCGTFLAGGASCTVSILFAPSQAGVRGGILSVTAGSSTPVLVSLSGTGVAITSASNSAVNFGNVPVNEPAVQWLEVTQGFSALTVNATAGFGVVLVADEGFGHGTPAASAFTASVTGMCSDCWIGTQFLPTAVGTVNGTLSITSVSGGNANVLTLSGTGVLLTGEYFSPAGQDFGAVAVHSTSGGEFFTLTNGSAAAIALGAPVVTANYAVMSTTCSNVLAAGNSCLVQVEFVPTGTGKEPGTLSLVAGGTTVTGALTGHGNSDPGVAFSPSALNFTNLPGGSETSGTITVTNPSGSQLQIGAVSTTTNYFSATTSCGVLAANASCTIQVGFTPQSATVSDVLTVPVTNTAGTVNYSIPLNGEFTAEDAGVVMTPGEMDFGTQATGTMGLTRVFTVTNLTANVENFTIEIPRQFALSGAACTTVAAYGSCQFAVQFDPLTNGPITGSLLLTGSGVSGIAYMQGVGSGSGVLGFSNNVSGGIVNFGLVTSGQSASQTVTITNLGSVVLNVRRITTETPFTSTTNCAAPLAVNASCTVTVTFSPLAGYVAGSETPTPQNVAGTLEIESDAVSGPDVIDLSGAVSPVENASPNNAGAAGSLSESVGSLNFAATMLGNVSAAQTVMLTNSGTSTVAITALSAGAGFTVTDVNCVGNLPVGGTCSFEVQFAPVVAGAQFSAVEIVSNASTSLDFVSVMGVATAAQLQLSASGLSFGNVTLNATAQQTLVVSNTGGTDVTITGITATGPYSVSGPCVAAGSVIAAGTSCTVTVTFSPTVVGTQTGVLSVASSATMNPLTATLTGTGVEPQLLVSATLLNFGTVVEGQSYTLPLTLRDTGQSNVMNIAMTIGGVNAGDFSLITGCGTNLAVGQSCTVSVIFTPTSYGVRTGTLTIASNDPQSPTVVNLSGFGQQNGGFTLSIAPGTSASATVDSGTPAVYNLVTASVGGYQGVVVISCSPEQTVLYASCAVLPGNVALNNNSVASVVTINTVTEKQKTAGNTSTSGLKSMACVMVGFVLLWKRRGRLPRLLAVALMMTLVMAGLQGCGGGNGNLEFTPPGSYTFLITAEAVNGVLPVQTVTLTLNVE